MQPSNYRSSILLACGALLAASGVVEKPLPENLADPVASVNGKTIVNAMIQPARYR
jgi:hypothetical protein